MLGLNLQSLLIGIVSGISWGYRGTKPPVGAVPGLNYYFIRIKSILVRPSNNGSVVEWLGLNATGSNRALVGTIRRKPTADSAVHPLVG